MAMTAYVLVSVCVARPVGNVDRAFCRAKTMPPCSSPAVVLRLLGAIELAGRWHFEARHVPGELIEVAGGI